MSYLMMDLASYQLTNEEIDRITHPNVGGIILFSRNYQNKAQLLSLIYELRKIKPQLIIAVDHEGGRVQRFIDGFSTLPAMGQILPAANHDMNLACSWAKELGFLMAIELLACDIDLSFAPVLDLNKISRVIGNRSFSHDASDVILLATSFIDGMDDAGMAAVGKHFPGHGSVEADSHIAIPVDPRSFDEINALDMQPFNQLIANDKLLGIMPAHVIYSCVDANPAGFSSYWLQQILRNELGFNGIIFSDDLGMKGASVAGDYCQRAQAALNAGCNMILLCNDSQGVQFLLDNFTWPDVQPAHSLTLLKPNSLKLASALENSHRWQSAKIIADQINHYHTH